MVEPEPDERWTSDQQLDRLAPLTTSLRHWSPVYERWRSHESATARPQQPRFDRADLSAIDDLRSVHFGQFVAVSRRLRTAGEALTRIAESTTAARSALADAWRDGASQQAVPRFDDIQRTAQDCADLCERLGLHLQSAIVDTVATVLKSAVDEIPARSRRWEQTAARTSREVWEQRIAELDAAGPDPAGTSAQWPAELDALVVDYDAVIGVCRATLSAAANTVARAYQVLHREIGPREETPSGSAPSGVAEPDVGAAPASTALASAGSDGADAPAAASSSAGGGGGGGSDSDSSGVAPGTGPGGAGADGSALLGQLSDLPAAGSGGATVASVSDADPGYAAGAATAGAGGPGIAPMAGALGAGAPDDQQRAARPWGIAATEDRAREASWARLRALLGEDAGEHPEPGRAGR